MSTTTKTKKEKPAAPKVFYTSAELMERWQVCRSTIYNEIAREGLKPIRIGGQLRFLVEDVEKYERSRRDPS